MSSLPHPASSARFLQLLVLPLSPQVHPQDQALAGIYPAEVSVEVPEDEAARGIIDLFVQRHRPRRPDDFSFQVFDQERVLTEASAPVSGIEVRLGGRIAR